MKTRRLIWALTGGLWLASTACLQGQAYVFDTLAGDASTLDEWGYPLGGYAEGTNSGARFNSLIGMAVDAAGTLFVGDTLNHAIRQVRRVGNDWVVTTIAGAGPNNYGSLDGANTTARFNFPAGVAVDAGGNLYVADMSNATIRKVSPVEGDWVVSTIAGFAGEQGTNDGPGSAARFAAPLGVALDTATNLYVADSGNNSIRKLAYDGTNWAVTTIAGRSGAAGSDDGSGSEARFSSPRGIAVDGANNIFVTDLGNQTIRKLTPVGTNWVVSTIAGAVGEFGTNDGPGISARFAALGGLALDPVGVLFVADNQMIRELTPAEQGWTVRTVAGAAWEIGTADGTGGDARFCDPDSLAVDAAGSLYVADTDNQLVRRGLPAPIPPPTLQVRRSGEELVLSWPRAARAYALETVAPLDSASSWTRLTPGAVLLNESLVVTNNLGPTNGFFRLRKP
jgi:sugar lactone lactonase YvrE